MFLQEKNNVAGIFRESCNPNVISDPLAAAAYNTRTSLKKINTCLKIIPKNFIRAKNFIS